MLIRSAITVLFLLAPISSYSQINWVKNERINPDEVSSARIVYHGEVNSRLVSELILALDEINNNYPALKAIRLYISSFGGSMESGYLAYQVIKASSIPVETINAGITGSAATLMYCGAKNRYTLPEATFILHPAAAYNTKKEWVMPNDIELMRKDVEDGNIYFEKIYNVCTTLKKQDIATMLSSNDKTRYIRSAEAKNIALSQDDISGIASAQISYFITNDDK